MNLRSLIIGLVLVGVAGGVFLYFVSRPLPAPAPLPESEEPTGDSSVIEDSGPYHEAQATYPTKTPLTGAANTSAVAAMKAWAEQTVAEFKTNTGISTITEEDVKMLRLDERKYVQKIEYKTYESERTVSYVFLIYEDTLGAHPNAYYKTFTFDRETGYELSISDLFETGSNYLSALSVKSRAALVSQIAEAAQIEEADVDRQMLNAGTTPVAENFQWFYLSGEALVLVFPPYSIGPWVLGAQTVTLPRGELSAYLKSAYQFTELPQ